MDPLEEQILLYKEFPLLLHSPDYTKWDGYLCQQGPALRIKFILPFYPELKNMTFECSPAIKNCVMSQLDNLTNCKTLRGFIYSILHVLKYEPLSDGDNTLWDSGFIKSTLTFLYDLETIVHKENILKISENFRDTKIKYVDSENSDHTLTFSIPHDYPRGGITVLEADLPTEIKNGLSKADSVEALYESFKENVENLLPFWRMCKLLEEKAWVIDPLNPQKKDTYRRILINDNLSVILNFNPLNLTACPDLKFIGSSKAVADAREKFMNNFEEHGWLEELDIIENLLNLLDIKKFLTKNTTIGNDNNENNCYICFTYIVDNEEPPAKWCTNKNCSSWYHYSCLVQWLMTVISSVRLFDHISGPCPYCDEKLWCPLDKDSK